LGTGRNCCSALCATVIGQSWGRAKS